MKRWITTSILITPILLSMPQAIMAGNGQHQWKRYPRQGPTRKEARRANARDQMTRQGDGHSKAKQPKRLSVIVGNTWTDEDGLEYSVAVN
jgi:hypothetical protein